MARVLKLNKFDELYSKLKRKDINKTNLLYMLYKISNIEYKQEVPQTLLPVNFHDIKDQNEMNVDDDNEHIQQDRKLDHSHIIKSFRFRTQGVTEELL